MLVAKFGPGTAWIGKRITFEDEHFALEGHGPITAADVMEYDRQGNLVWASDGTRAWVGSRASISVHPATATPESSVATRARDGDDGGAPGGREAGDASAADVQRLVKRIRWPISAKRAHADIGLLGRQATPQAIEALEGLLASGQLNINLMPAIAEQLRSMGPAADPALHRLLQVSRARWAVLGVLGTSVGSLGAKLEEPLKSGRLPMTTGTRVRLIHEIGALGSPEAVDELAYVMSQSYQATAVYAAAADELARLGDPGRAALASDEIMGNKGVRQHARKALGLPPDSQKSSLAQHDGAVELRSCRVLGGSGFGLQAGESCNLAFLTDRLELHALLPEAKPIAVLYDNVVALEIGGPGEQTSGGGFIGGGFGVDGAVTGMLVATAINMLTSRTKVSTVVCLQTATAELYLHTEAVAPDKLRMTLSPVFTYMRQHEGTRRSSTQVRATDSLPGSLADEIAKLAELYAQGSITDEEFAAFKAKLME